MRGIRVAILAAVALALALPATSVSRVSKGEGKLTMIAWEGYLDAKWVKPFQQQTGCKIQAKYAGSSDEMVTLLRSGGGGQYDMV
jgi:putative spermidine/putrescine transport system substrate-binding protein